MTTEQRAIRIVTTTDKNRNFKARLKQRYALR